MKRKADRSGKPAKKVARSKPEKRAEAYVMFRGEFLAGCTKKTSPKYSEVVQDLVDFLNDKAVDEGFTMSREEGRAWIAARIAA